MEQRWPSSRWVWNPSSPETRMISTTTCTCFHANRISSNCELPKYPMNVNTIKNNKLIGMGGFNTVPKCMTRPTKHITFLKARPGKPAEVFVRPFTSAYRVVVAKFKYHTPFSYVFGFLGRNNSPCSTKSRHHFPFPSMYQKRPRILQDLPQLRNQGRHSFSLCFIVIFLWSHWWTFGKEPEVLYDSLFRFFHVIVLC